MYTLEFVSSYHFFFFSNLLTFYTFRILLNEFVWDEQKLDIDVIWFFFFWVQIAHIPTIIFFVDFPRTMEKYLLFKITD